MIRRPLILVLMLFGLLLIDRCVPALAGLGSEVTTPAAYEPQPPGGSEPAPTLASIPTPTPRPVPAGPPRSGQAAPDWTLPDLDGAQVSLSDYRGQAVMMTFWATWCGYCRMGIPHMVDLYAERAEEGFVILALDMREDRQTVRAYADVMDMRFPILLDAHGEVAGRYYVRGIPTSVFVDREGIVQWVHIGVLSEEQLREYAAGLLD